MMRGTRGPVLLVVLTVLVAIVGGCTSNVSNSTYVPTPGPMSTFAATPTSEPLPASSPALNITHIPGSSADPIIGTWEWQGDNNTVAVFTFRPDGTFQRQDQGTGWGPSTGTWANEGGGSYKLVYAPGNLTEHVIYYPNAGTLGNRSSYFSRA